MKVVIVNRGMGIYRGGGEIYDLRLTEQLTALGATVEYVAGAALRGTPKTPEPPVATTYVRTAYLRALAQSLPPYVRPAVSEFDMLMFEQGAFRAIRRRGADVVHLNGMPVLAAAVRRLGMPTVLVFHGRPRRIFDPFIRRATAVVSYGDTLQHLRGGVRPDTVDVPPGLDATSPPPPPGLDVRRELNVPRDAFVVLFVGRLVPIKNLPLLMEGFARAVHQNARLHLLLCGEGQLRAPLERRVERLGLRDRVHWAGYVPHQDLAAYYRASDALAITSAYDNFPFVVLEAMAAGLPVVGTRVGGIPLQVDEGATGLLVRPGDADELARVFTALAQDRGRASRMGEAARDRVRTEFSWSRSARRLYQVYERALGVV